MSTLLINASPKKRWSNSAYFMGFSKLFMNSRSNKCTKVKLPFNKKKYEDIFSLIRKSDKVVIATPLYVDGIPSHVLRFLKELEIVCKEEKLSFKLYVLSNCGFYEGAQTRNLLAQVKLWCKKANIEWAGGIGIGAGEMLGFLRINFVIYIIMAIFSLLKEIVTQIINSSYSISSIFGSLNIKGFSIRIGILLLFNLMAAYTLIKLGTKVRKGKFMKIRYTGVSFCPKFLFVIFANIFWLLRLSIVNHRLPQRIYDKEIPDYSFNKNDNK